MNKRRLDRQNGSKQFVSCLVKALWHTVQPYAPARALLAQLVHTKTYTHNQEEKELFRSEFTLPSPTCLIVCCDCFPSHKQSQLQLQMTKRHRGEMFPVSHVGFRCCRNHAGDSSRMVVDLKGSACVIRHGFVIMLPTRGEFKLAIIQL